MNISVWFILFMPLLYQLTAADCGCGIRCVKYSTADQCSRCCTATVRRSVPVQEEAQNLQPIRIFDRELSKPVETPSYFTIPRKTYQKDKEEVDQLSKLISSLYVEEFKAKSKKQRRVLQKTRSKLQHYRRIRLDGIRESDSQEEMYELLDLLLKKLRTQDRNSTRGRFER